MRTKRLSFNEFGPEAIAPDGSVEEEDLTARMLRRMLLRTYEGELTLRQKQCLALFYGEGMNQKQIAAALDISPSTVCRHLEKGLERLRRVVGYCRRN